MNLNKRPGMHLKMYAKDFLKNTKGSPIVHSGEPNQMLPKSRMQYISGQVPSFSSICDEHGQRFHQHIASMKNIHKRK